MKTKTNRPNSDLPKKLLKHLAEKTGFDFTSLRSNARRRTAKKK